jgi:hypothetical protein
VGQAVSRLEKRIEREAALRGFIGVSISKVGGQKCSLFLGLLLRGIGDKRF